MSTDRDTPEARLESANARAPLQNTQDDSDKPELKSSPTPSAKEHQKPQKGSNGKFKMWWAGLGLDVPTVLMMLK